MSRYKQNKAAAFGITEGWMRSAKKATDRVFGEGYARAHPELISAFMTTVAANFATLTEREIAEAEEVTTINIRQTDQGG